MAIRNVKFVVAESNGALPVNIQDQHSLPLDSLFAQSISNFTLEEDTVASGISSLVYDFTAATGHGIAISNEILLLDVTANRSLQAVVLNVVGDVITLDRPIDLLFPAVSTLGRIITTEMAVDGSSVSQIFSLRAGSPPTDATRFMLTMLGGVTSMDDGKFGNIDALTRGLVFRIYNSFQKTMLNFKTNKDIKQFSYDVRYSDNAPAGSTGLSSRISYGGQDKHGITLRIGTDEVIQWIVQDDLTGLTSVKISAQGHEVFD